MFRNVKRLLALEFIMIIVLGVVLIKEKLQSRPLKRDFQVYSAVLERLRLENAELKQRLRYLQNPENLKKEMKKKFNLAEPGEKIIIFSQ